VVTLIVFHFSICEQSEMRARADQVTKEQLICEVQQLRGVVDTFTAVSSGSLLPLILRILVKKIISFEIK
jgi:hypothetical protein